MDELTPELIEQLSPQAAMAKRNLHPSVDPERWRMLDALAKLRIAQQGSNTPTPEQNQGLVDRDAAATQKLALKQGVFDKALDQRKALARRNIAAMQPSDPAMRTIPPERMAALMGNGGGTQSMASVASADPYADTPADVARKAAMSKLKLRGETADTGFGSRRTVGRPLVKGASGEEKAALEEALSNDKRIASRAAQGDQARKNLAAYADGSKKRPHHVTEAERKADGRQLMADREAALVKAQMAPYLDYVRAQHPDNPHHVAAANKDNAIAAAIRAQMTQEAPGPGAMPGAASEPAAVPPGGATSAGLGGTSIPRGPGTYLPPHPTTGMEVLPPWGRDGTNIRKRPKPTVPVEPGIDYSLPGF